MKLVVTQNRRVAAGRSHVDLTVGDVLDETAQSRLPSGALKSLCRTGVLVPEADRAKYIGEPTKPVETPPNSGDKPSDTGDKVATKINYIGLTPKYARAFYLAGLGTVADVLRYGQKHGSLAGIPGIGEEGEREFQQAVTKLMA